MIKAIGTVTDRLTTNILWRSKKRYENRPERETFAIFQAWDFSDGDMGKYNFWLVMVRYCVTRD